MTDQTSTPEMFMIYCLLQTLYVNVPIAPSSGDKLQSSHQCGNINEVTGVYSQNV